MSFLEVRLGEFKFLYGTPEKISTLISVVDTRYHPELVVSSISQSISKFITRHSTEARATMSLSQTEKERLKSVLKNVYRWSSPTAQW